MRHLIGDRVFDPAARTLSAADGRSEGAHHLTPLEYDVLGHLLANTQRHVPMVELIDRFWRGNAHAEGSVRNVIWRLRKALGDREAIESLQRRGYRLVPEVTELPPAPPDNQARSERRGWRGGIAAAAVLGWMGLMAAIAPPAPRQDEPAPPEVQAAVQVRWAQLTTGTTPELHPALSPDGSLLAYSVPHDDGWDLYLRDLRTGETRQLTATDGLHEAWPRWSADGRRIAFTEISDRCVIRVLDLEGAATGTLGECELRRPMTFDWDSERQQLLVSRTADDPSAPPSQRGRAIFLVDLVSGEERRVSFTNRSDQLDAMPRFSPQGDRFAFTRRTADSHEVVIARTDDGAVAWTSGSSLWAYTFDWVDQHALLVWGDDGVQRTHWLWELGADRWKRLAGPAGGGRVDVAGHGSVLVTERRDLSRDIHTLDLHGGAVTLRVPADGHNLFPTISPDGRTMAYVSDRGGSSQIWLQDLAEGSEAQVTDFEGVPLARLVWRPDGSGMAFQVIEEGRLSYRYLDLATGAARPLLDARWGTVTGLTWSQDGRSLYLLSDRTMRDELWRYDMTTGHEVQLTDGGAVELQNRPVRGTVVFRREGHDPLLRLDLASQEVETLAVPMSSLRWSWALRGEGSVLVAYSEESPSRIEIREHRLDGSGEAIVHGSIPSPVVFPPFLQASADGSAVVLVRRASQADLYLGELGRTRRELLAAR